MNLARRCANCGKTTTDVAWYCGMCKGWFCRWECLTSHPQCPAPEQPQTWGSASAARVISESIGLLERLYMSPNLDASTAVAERLKRALMELQLLRLDIESYVERYLEGPK